MEDAPELTNIGGVPVAQKADVADDIHRYLVVTDDRAETWYELGPAPLTIGRDSTRDIVLADTNVSRMHAQVVVSNSHVVVTDLGSTNGTFLEGKRLKAPTRMIEGAVLQIAGKRLRYVRRSKREVERAQELHRDLEKASHYVLSLLPPPMTDDRVSTEWFFLPSARLGGDAFGYEWLDPDTFVHFIVDVSGHGIDAAMHSVSALNVLRRKALPNTDFTKPDQVLASLNAMFQMDEHDGMYFTMWYGVYQPSTRVLTYASAGHHPSYLLPQGKTTATPLRTPSPMIGASLRARYRSEQVTVTASSSLYLFSDGVFEITTHQGKQWRLSDFLPLLSEPAVPGIDEPKRLYQAIKRVSGDRALDDDFSLLAITLT